jgi:hypothetical protein
MRKSLIILVLCLCFCSSITFAANILTKADNPTVTAVILDANAPDSGPIGAITNAINKLDAWIQKNLW